MPTETADWVGLTLDGRYAVAARLGEGGMGFVYRARDTRLNCDVVVKVPRAAMLEEAGFRARFRAEVGALVRLAHPHVVSVTDFGQHDGVPFAVMQFLPGGSLEDRRPRDADGHPKPVAARTLAHWLPAVADALDFIHKQGYVHRDVKPANILFDAHKNAFISDFGVAKAVAGGPADQLNLTGEGKVLGTPNYMAPELVLGDPVDGRIDQYALAVTVYELLAGRPPFTGTTPMAVLVKRTTDDPPPLAVVQPATPAGVSAAVGKALSREPSRRYPTCAAFAAAVLAGVDTAPANRATAATGEVYALADPRTGRRPLAATRPPPLPRATPVHRTVSAGEDRAPPTGSHTALLFAALGGVAVCTAVIGLAIWLATRGGTHRACPEGVRPEIYAGTKTPASNVPAPPVAHTPGSPKPATTLRTEPDAVALLAGGPWVPLTVTLERTDSRPAQVDLRPPFGVEARPSSVSVGASESVARFELRAAAGAVARTDAAILSVRGMAVRNRLPVTVRRLDFRADLVEAGEIVLAAGQKRTVEVRLDRSGGYAGPLTATVAATPVVTAATVPVPAGATTIAVPLAAKPDAPPGTAVVRIHFAAQDGGTAADLAVTVRIPAVAAVQSFTGHAGKVNAVALSPDGKLAISGGADATVRLWDTSTGAERWKADGHAGEVLSVAFAPDGRAVLSSGADKSIRVWDTATAAGRMFDKQHDAEIWLVRFVDAKTAVSISADKTVHWVVATGKPVQMPDGRKDFILGQKYKADVGPGEELKAGTRVPTESGEFFVSGVGGPMATLWRKGATDKAPPRTVARIPAQGTSHLKLIAASRDASRVLTVTEDNAVRVWDARAMTARLLPGFPWTPDESVTATALDGDGRRVLLAGPDGGMKLWRVP
jgi:hypothetical protein